VPSAQCPVPMLDLTLISIAPEQFILDVIDPQQIVVINLDRRPDRWTALQEAWSPGVAQRLTRFSAVDGRELPPERVEENRQGRDLSYERIAGELGCRESWSGAVEQYGPGLYFEDDARPCQLWSYGPPPDDAEVVLLGGNLWPQKVAEPGWASISHSVFGGHAVWIRTQKAADALVRAWRKPVQAFGAIDVLWMRPLKRANAVVAVPQIVYQVDIGTDVQMGRVDEPGGASSYEPWCSLQGGEPA
jgi:hypothetical protein